MGQPKTILILRHGEKTTDGSDEFLSLKGKERAAGLAYFMPATFGQIDHIFAAGVSADSESCRPQDTIYPLAHKINVPLRRQFMKTEIPQMVQFINANDIFTDSVVVICWQHTLIQEIATTFGAVDVPAGKWHGHIFDLVWKLTLQSNKTYSIEQIPQLLLYGDTDELISQNKKDGLETT
jgi:hypothetical protein